MRIPLNAPPSITHVCIILGLATLCMQCGTNFSGPTQPIVENDHIVLVGNNLCSRMMNYGYFETEMHQRFPDHKLTIRNMCDGGNTLGFRPHSGRISPWAFPGADTFYTELAQPSDSQGHFETPDQWLTRLQADIIVAFFGFNESFAGLENVASFEAEMDAFVSHTLSQLYNGETPPGLVLVSPIAFEDLSHVHDLPDGSQENIHLAAYSQAIQRVAQTYELPFADVFSASKKWYRRSQDPLTIDGSQLNDEGYKLLSSNLVDQVFGGDPSVDDQTRENILSAVLDKNWHWHNDFKIPNGVHVFGRRFEPFGPDNYPAELEKIRQLTAIRDTAIWHIASGIFMDLATADARTLKLPEIVTNYEPSVKNGELTYLYGDDALATFTTAPGYEVTLFASEVEFPDLANPVQMSFDNQGRLWVAVMPSYPHWKPGDALPNDKLIIFEDTDLDGKADKQTIWADGLHLPVGFEFAPEGVYVSQGTNLILLSDTDGDDQADTKEIVLSGFDDHDTHHVISAFTADPSGAIYMAEGVFLHTNVETSYGPSRGTHGGFFRFNPKRHHLERTAQVSIPNPWGIAFDKWGQPFYAETSGPDVRWMSPATLKPLYGISTHKSYNLIEDAHKVRPTSGLEFVSSRHFPDEVQGDLLINNTIGFLGMKQHKMEDDGTGYTSSHRHDLVQSTDGNFRPVDMEFAPDGSLYFIDWHNILIGHMQHNARDPLRDHEHGRIYRITYPSRPLLEPAKIVDATIEELLENLTLPEFRSRYRTRRELRGRNPEEVLSQIDLWVNGLDSTSEGYEHLLLETLWVTWGINQVDEALLNRLLHSEDFRVRSAAVRALRYNPQIETQIPWLAAAATDLHGRVQTEVMAAASWLTPDHGIPIVQKASQHNLDKWNMNVAITAIAHLNGRAVPPTESEEIIEGWAAPYLALYTLGREVYSRDGYCSTCHQPDGKGLPASGFPPLAGTEWVTGNPERLIKLTLDGLIGPMTVDGVQYTGQVPMTPFRGLLNDEELAAVLTYVRNAFGNRASAITPEQVAGIRESTSNRQGYYTVEELMQDE